MTDIDSIAGRGRRAHGAPGTRIGDSKEKTLPREEPLAGPLAEVIQEPGSLCGHEQGPAGGRNVKGEERECRDDC